MNQRVFGCGWRTPVLRLLPQVIIGIVLSAAAAEAGMQLARFALDYKPKFVASKSIPSLCDNPATVTEEPNYSPNYTNTPCTNYTVTAPLGAGQVYLVIAKAGTEGVAAASFGISYCGSKGAGIDPEFVTWTPCADGLQFPNNDGVHGNFPQPGGGMRITWNNSTSCQTEVIGHDGVHAVVGVFYVYAYSRDFLQITPNNNLQGGVPELAVANCAGVTTDLYQVWGPAIVVQLMGRVGFNAFGYSPCGGYAAEISTLVMSPCDTPVRPTSWGRMKSMYEGGH